MKNYYVYILTNYSKTLYAGITNDLYRRLYQHREKTALGFTSKYKNHRLVYYEVYNDVRHAIAREKQIKGWLRAKRVALIESMNPTWRDLKG